MIKDVNTGLLVMVIILIITLVATCVFTAEQLTEANGRLDRMDRLIDELEELKGKLDTEQIKNEGLTDYINGNGDK